MDQERLQKIIANSGLCSRRKAEELIEQKRVLVNGKVATIGKKASKTDNIVVDGEALSQSPKKLVYYKFNKPNGYTCTNRKFENEKNIFDIIDIKEKLIIVGRLDKDSNGLLILTNDGQLAQKITHPKFGIQKEYLVQADRSQSPKVIVKEFLQGIESEGDLLVADKVLHQGNDKYLITLSQGKKRQIRRMFEALNSKVISLQRIRIGNIRLDNLPTGKLETIKPEDIKKLSK
jgi:pseudouridine synthase